MRTILKHKTLFQNHYSDTLNMVAIALSGFSSILMMAACASYSDVTANIVNVPWAIYKHNTINVITKTSGKGDDIEFDDDSEMIQVMQQWIGLRGVVTQGFDGKGVASGEPVTSLFADNYDEIKCPNDEGNYTETCIALEKCLGTGKVCVAFIVIGFLLAMVSMALSSMRMKGDGYFKKLIAFIFSCSTIVCCVIAYSAFSPCLGYNWVIRYDRITDVYQYMYPGAGGAMAITSFVFFGIVAVINAVMPAGTADVAQKEEGSENKA